MSATTRYILSFVISENSEPGAVCGNIEYGSQRDAIWLAFMCIRALHAGLSVITWALYKADSYCCSDAKFDTSGESLRNSEWWVAGRGGDKKILNHWHVVGRLGASNVYLRNCKPEERKTDAVVSIWDGTERILNFLCDDEPNRCVII